MTSEVAILNQEAVAIAADSSSTMTSPNGQKILTSANRIFSLSKSQPVGIMVYGNANLMGTPWETIIKIFRQRLEKKWFKKLENYADEFIDFLQKENKFYPDEIQTDYFNIHTSSYLNDIIRKEIDEKIKIKYKENNNKITEKEGTEIITGILKKHYDLWKNASSTIPNFERNFNSFKRKYQKNINEIKKKFFKKLTSTQSKYLTDIAVFLFLKYPEQFTHSGMSGVVITGFRESEIYPSLKSFLIDGVANNILNYRIHNHTEINHNNSASIIPFAQQEMVHSFMQGINPQYNDVILDLLSNIINEYPKTIIDKIKSINDKEKRRLINELIRINDVEFKKSIDKLKDFREENFVKPILEVVNFLPKNELAEMAESLVNLTVFKKRISLEDETVGGPIDVAVISKGDGLIWIKRKHYFDSKLNQHFFSNYYNFIKKTHSKYGKEK